MLRITTLFLLLSVATGAIKTTYIDRFWSPSELTQPLTAACGKSVKTPLVWNRPQGESTYSASVRASGDGLLTFVAGPRTASLPIPFGGCDPCVLSVPVVNTQGYDNVYLQLKAYSCDIGHGASMQDWQYETSIP